MLISDECDVLRIPQNGALLNSSGDELRVGQRVAGTIYIRCQHSSIIPPIERSQCQNGQWVPEIPNCGVATKCPPINSTELWVFCAYNGIESFCSSPSRPGSIATARCPHQYIHSERKLTCAENGVWKWSDTPLQCRHECGITSDDYSTPWDLTISNKMTGINGCYAVILNSVYLATTEECMWMYNRNADNAAIIVNDNDMRDVKPFEKEEYRFAFIKITSPIKFSRWLMPICSDDEGVGIGDDGFEYSLDMNRNCYNPTYDPTGSTKGASCAVHNEGCMYASGSAFHSESKTEVNGRLRHYIGGIGRRPRKTADDGENYYRCKLPVYRSFRPSYFTD